MKEANNVVERNVADAPSLTTDVSGEKNMSILVIPILLLVLVLPVAWFISEFKSDKRSTRCLLGSLAILCCFGVAWLAAQLCRLNYNAWYGSASKRLIDTTITQIESGDHEVLLRELKQLQADFRPTYENRAHYDELVKQSVERIQKECGEPANNALERDD